MLLLALLEFLCMYRSHYALHYQYGWHYACARKFTETRQYMLMHTHNGFKDMCRRILQTLQL